MNTEKTVDPIPAEFPSYEDAAEFWDIHDTTDYPEAFRTVKITAAKLERRRYELEIDEDVARLLRTYARQRGVAIGALASELLRKQLPLAS